MAQSRPSRRSFIHAATGLGVTLPFAQSLRGATLLEELMRTPEQTAGPFYPVPEIAKQKHSDADLTRQAADGPVAEGEVIQLEGQVVGIDGKPIHGSIVEVWQACHSGRYQHTRDTNPAPLDPNFQYWARVTTTDEGRYSLKTIVPGKYPGRTPHVHFRILAEGYPELVTQMYFEKFGEANQKDGIYGRLSQPQKELVTVAFAPADIAAGTPAGKFRIVLAPQASDRATPPMP